MKKKITKKDEIMAFADFEDATGACELIIFPQVLTKYAFLLNEGSILCLTVKISKKNDGETKAYTTECHSRIRFD